MINVRWSLAVMAGLACAPGCFSTVKPPKVESGAPMPQPGQFPHETLDEVLSKHVDDQGRVDYVSLAAERGPLETYVELLARVSPHSDPELFPSKEDELAYWINAYNALVLYAVTERPAMQSVNDDKVNFFYFTRYLLGGEKVSLYNLENGIVRKEFKEPRIHFALNCASIGCPELPPEAFFPERLEDQLAREATGFCAHPEKVQVEGDVVRMSKIFDWYSGDFEAAGGAVAFCRKWGREDLPRKPEVQYLDYDWGLNAQPGRSLNETAS